MVSRTAFARSWAAMETRKREGQKKARLALLEHLLEGQWPITEEELAAVHEEWQR
jgi:hypothetical protein